MRRQPVLIACAAFAFGWSMHPSPSALAQSLNNVRATFDSGRVQITYDLIGEDPEQKFNLNLFGSHDYYSAPLVTVSGDVGNDITAGEGKRIEWDAAADLRDFKGHIIFKVRGEAVALPFVFKSPVSGAFARRGKSIIVEWKGGRRGETVRLQLLKDGVVLETLTELANQGAYAWKLPSKLKRGKYSLRLSAGSRTVQSEEFYVKARTPLALKVLPLVAVGAVVVVVSGSDGGPVDESTTNDLPVAPGPE